MSASDRILFRPLLGQRAPIVTVTEFVIRIDLRVVWLIWIAAHCRCAWFLSRVVLQSLLHSLTMGNVMSEEQEEEFLEEGFDLESPEADKQINFGTAAPNCQPRHTLDEEEKANEGQEVAMAPGDAEATPMKHRRDSSSTSSDDPQRKRQHLSESQAQKKMSYIQMAKMGYQELVNAIIRPPRAEYKVSC